MQPIHGMSVINATETKMQESGIKKFKTINLGISMKSFSFRNE